MKRNQTQAEKAHRKAVEDDYTGVCTITVYSPGQGLINNTIETVQAENVPCGLSFSSFPSTFETESITKLTQSVKLFINPEIEIRPGSKITVTQNGQTVDYKASSQAARYVSHQEINLELFKGWT